MATEMKLTQKMFFSDMIKLMSGEPTQFPVLELLTYAEGRIDKLEADAAKARGAERKMSPKQIAAHEESARLRTLILQVLLDAGEPLDREAIATEMTLRGHEMVGTKVTGLMKPLVDCGSAIKSKAKIDGREKTVYTITTGTIEIVHGCIDGVEF